MSGPTLPGYIPGSLQPLTASFPLVAWPGVPAGPLQLLLALCAQLEHTQWWSPEQLRAHQMEQARLVLRHAYQTSPYYRRALAGHDLDRLDEEGWLALPRIGRDGVREAGQDLLSRSVPKEHGAAGPITTSGSTGTPIRVVRTALFGMFWTANTLRELLWHKKDVSKKLVVFRFSHQPVAWPGIRSRGWGPWAAAIGPLGESIVLDISEPVDRQLELLVREQPEYLLTYPTNLGHLVEEAERRGVELPSLRSVTTLSEILTQEVRDRTRAVWKIPVQDLYSTQETGYLGLQCPDHEHFHVPSEDVVLEVLDESGRPCGPGEIGRVVATPLHNFAMPLVRYDVGDYAVVGEPCPCGRGLPVLRRVMGRVRNSILTASGQRIWPNFGTEPLTNALPVMIQHQLVQTHIDRIEMRLVLERPLTEGEREMVLAHLAGRMPEGFRVDVVEVEAIPRSAGGKFEDFLSLVER